VQQPWVVLVRSNVQTGDAVVIPILRAQLSLEVLVQQE